MDQIRASNTDASMGISPFEIQQEVRRTWWIRLAEWIRRWSKRGLPFLFVLTLGAEEAQGPQMVPDSLTAKYWKARSELSAATQQIVVFCKGDFGFTAAGDLACVPQTTPAKPTEEKK